MRQAIWDRRTDAGLGDAIDGKEQSELIFDCFAHFGFRNECVRASVLRAATTGGTDLVGSDSAGALTRG